MQKKEVLEATPRIREAGERLGVNCHAQMDTNGLLIDSAVVRAMDALSITITNKADHNIMRVRKNKTGTYEAILKKIRRHAEDFNDAGCVLAVRFNVHAMNAKYVPEVYTMVRGLGIKYTDFDLYEVVNYDFNLMVPTLTRDQYKKLYLDLIKLKVESGEVVDAFPRPTFAPCSGYTPFNIKVMASGKLAVCDAPQEEVGALAQLLDDPTAHGQIFPDQAEHNPFQHPRCGGCPNIGICGGEYFCKFNPHAEEQNPCDFLPFDMDEFLRYFAEQAPKTPQRFVFETTA